MIRNSLILLVAGLLFYFFPWNYPEEILEFRIFRAIDLCLVGASLCGTGFVAQTIFRNDLADPFNLGISSFTGLGMVIAVFLSLPISLGAIVGSLFCCFGMVLLARISDLQGALLIVAGVVFGFFASAAMHVLVNVIRPDIYPRVQALLLGDFYALGGGLSYLFPLVILLALLMLRGFCQRLDILSVSEMVYIQQFGSPQKIYYQILVLISLLISFAVLKAGIVGFIGLVVPHFVKRLYPCSHQKLYFPVLIVGAALSLLMDRLGQTYLGPVPIPFGIVSMIVGAPLFIWILMKGRTT